MFVKNNLSNLEKKNNYSFIFNLCFSKKEIRNYIYKIYKIPVYEVNTNIYYYKRIYKKNKKVIFKGKNKKFKKVVIKLKKFKFISIKN